MSQLSQEDIDSIIDDVRDELDSMSESERRSVTRSEESFVQWLRRKIRDAARFVGEVIALPFRIISDIIEAFLEGLFGR